MNYRKIPDCGLGGSGIPIEVYCDGGNILTNGGVKAKIGIFGFLKEKRSVGIKIKLT